MYITQKYYSQVKKKKYKIEDVHKFLEFKDYKRNPIQSVEFMEEWTDKSGNIIIMFTKEAIHYKSELSYSELKFTLRNDQLLQEFIYSSNFSN